MSQSKIDDQRIRRLNDRDTGSGRYVLYWMQQSQRAECNHALEFAVRRANAIGKPLLVAFGLTADYPDANLRHYHFLLGGLALTAKAIERRGLGFVLRFGRPDEVAVELGGDAAEVVCDRGYLRHHREWRGEVARRLAVPVWQVESDAIVPVETTSSKREYAARTIRPKIHRQLTGFLKRLATTPIENGWGGGNVVGEPWSDVDGLLGSMSIDRSVQPVPGWTGGTASARARLRSFIDEELSRYETARHDVTRPSVSHLSPYLHFGQISPLVIALEVEAAEGVSREAKDGFLEELVVRRELAINFIRYTDDYDQFSCLPGWAAQTLAEHRDDPREPCYTAAQFESAATHDPAWNAAMTEMKERGYLHNHLRMYWGKKILHWSSSPEQAYGTALELNNKYFLDGRDPNSYANVAWLFGLHDRPHQEREVFGKVRYMSEAGLKRKIDVGAYVRSVSAGRREGSSA